MAKRYWDNEGLYEGEAALLQDLVPMSGKTGTYKGEIWRAATKIYYDYYNNGFGNFWIEPAMFLMDHVRLPDAVKQVLFDHANGNMANSDYDDEMELMIDTVIERLMLVENVADDRDMWEYKNPSLAAQFAPEETWEDEEEDYWDEEEDYEY